jgi:hypothetical protein
MEVRIGTREQNVKTGICIIALFTIARIVTTGPDTIPTWREKIVAQAVESDSYGALTRKYR